MEQYHGTTILGVKKGKRTVIAGDGQVSLGNTVIKPNARKVRRIGEDGKVIGGFAGATADAFTLFERLERKLEQYNGQLMRAAIPPSGSSTSPLPVRISSTSASATIIIASRLRRYLSVRQSFASSTAARKS